MSSFTLAIVGRPNVGKSTLFNRLCGKKRALVSPMPGMTRDRKRTQAGLAGLAFDILDTAGMEVSAEGSLQARMMQQTETAIAEADAVMLMLDGRSGLTPQDHEFAQLLRRQDKPVLVVVNKCEGRTSHLEALEAHALGLGEPVSISAEHGEGMAELYEALAPLVTAREERQTAEAEDTEQPIRVAIIGRPNAGKSTLINRILGEERLLTGPEAGITRDAITLDTQFLDRDIQLVDTAGMRKKANINKREEKLSVQDSTRSLREAQVVVLLLDATGALEKQDLTLAALAEKEGRAVVLAINKWDLVEDKKAYRDHLDARLVHTLPDISGLPVVTLSALKGTGLKSLQKAVLSAYDVWNRRVPTAELNRWLDVVTQQHPPPMVQGRRIRLRYITQSSSRPPTFVVFSSRADKLPESYRRYLVGRLRDAFDLPGSPIRLKLRKGRNPYA